MALDLASHFADLARDGARETSAVMGGQEVRMVRIAPGGEGKWDVHAAADETVLVWSGKFDVEFRDHTDKLSAGQVCVVPAGMEHRGTSSEGAEIVLFKAMA